MAALFDTSPPAFAGLGDASIVDLRKLRAEDLEPILLEEVDVWRTQFDWDFKASADLVRRFVQMQALSGFALVRQGRPIGYSYYVAEERKGLVGDLYVRQGERSVEMENLLLGAVVNALLNLSFVKRVESQLMMLQAPLTRALPNKDLSQSHPRHFMEADLEAMANLQPRRGIASLVFEPWAERRQDSAAQVIGAAYQGHVDSKINDQYRSISGARRFLMNIVQYPGCGAFFQPGSFVALDPVTGRMAGLSLASLVSNDIGHITQICVAPEYKGKGLGYELLRQSMEAMRVHGCRRVSLTVTAANEDAIRLYRRLGYSIRKVFAAYVWEPKA
ncbi:MAG: GNAT family N-acetyltransferase [Bryobacteraceae bacterium]